MSKIPFPSVFRTGTSPISRRELLKLSAAGFVGSHGSGWFEAAAQAAADNPGRRRSCILLWMEGGPSTIDLFDLKPGHVHGGPFREIPTASPGVRISEHLPRLASHMNDIAIIRSMKTNEGDHRRGHYLLRTGYPPEGPVEHPSLGSIISKELPNEQNALPDYISIYPTLVYGRNIYSSGFLGPRYAPLLVDFEYTNHALGTAGFVEAPRISHLCADGISPSRVNARADLLLEMERASASRNPGLLHQSHAMAYEQAVRLMRSSAASAFNLDSEPRRLRELYGWTRFGQACLTARRLVERGVPFAEVTFIGWDTHGDNHNIVRRLSQALDAGWSTLIEDLRVRGLLETTTIVWMGEFGRTPHIDAGTRGREHWPNSFCTALAGAGIQGGQAYGYTSPDGVHVLSEPTDVKSFIATILKALKIDFDRFNMSNVGRPIRLADVGAKPIAEIVG